MERYVPKSVQCTKSSALQQASGDMKNTCGTDSTSRLMSPQFTELLGHRDSVEARANFVAIRKSRGNENRRWHGTTRKCNIGDNGITTFCTDSGCSLCCIIKTSFNLKFFKGATGWGRFGAGIYTSSTSSKFVSIRLSVFLLNMHLMIEILTFRSNDYSKNEGITSDWKALLLNKVVVGNGKKLTQDDITLTQPPSGYDSVSVLSWFSGWYTDKEPGSCRSSSRRGSEL